MVLPDRSQAATRAVIWSTFAWAAATSCACASAESPIIRSRNLRRSSTEACCVWTDFTPFTSSACLACATFKLSISLACLSAESPNIRSRKSTRSCRLAWCASSVAFSPARLEWLLWRSATVAPVRSQAPSRPWTFSTLTFTDSSSLLCLLVCSCSAPSRESTRSFRAMPCDSRAALSAARVVCAFFSSPRVVVADSHAASRRWSWSILPCAPPTSSSWRPSSSPTCLSKMFTRSAIVAWWVWPDFMAWTSFACLECSESSLAWDAFKASSSAACLLAESPRVASR
mmetsp:Transcript_60545/g.184966  ORF Transcript_60545/g.184966 Transcript_60545/m.184966 type:complete len:286 (+) Transcript_60545:916-1773(+)